MYKLVVLSSVLAMVASSPSDIVGIGGLGLVGPLGAHLLSPLAPPVVSAPLISPLAAVGPLGLGAHGLGINYRGPLSLAPGQPANILAADGRPLDTLSVNLDRAAHLTARAVDGAGLHLLKKRSAPLLAPLAPLAVSHTARIDLPSRLIGPVGIHGAPLAVAAPLGHLGSPIAPLGLGHLGPWGAAPLGLW